MKNILPIILVLFTAVVFNSGCKIYSLNDIGAIPENVKTVKVNFIENRAPYRNPLLSPSLTDRLKQRITSQTRLANTTGDNPHWEISGEITDYSVTTTGVSSSDGRQQTTINRLTVSVRITLDKHIDNKKEDFSISRSFDFSANQSLQAAESALLDEMIRNLTDEIFNRIFSNW
jgi:hypothetical protein